MEVIKVGHLPYNEGRSSLYVIGKGRNAQLVHCLTPLDAYNFIGWLAQAKTPLVIIKRRTWIMHTEMNAYLR